MELSFRTAELVKADFVRSNAATDSAASSQLRLLAYVHLRNIHASTGAGRTARQIVEHLAQREDINLHVLADANDKQRVLPLVQSPWTEYQYHTFASDTSRQQAKWMLLGQPRAEDFWPEVQIVYCTAESYVPVKKARLVVTAHDAAYFEVAAHAASVASLKTRLKWKTLFRRLTKRADMFHTVSQFSAERLGHFFPEIAPRIRWVYNGVTEHFFKPVSAAGRTFVEHAGLISRPFVLVPGGLHFRKNAELILAAAPNLLKRFPDLVIAVVNHSDPGYVKRAEGLGERFRLFGFVSDDALHALYATAHVVWFPSRYEGFGLPVVEAMACGAPVVGSNTSAIPEVAGDAALLVDPAQPDAHIDAISSLLTDSGARAIFAAAGPLRASRFRWSNSAAALKGHFDTLL